MAFNYLGLPGKYVQLCKNNFIGSDSTEYFLDSVFYSAADNVNVFEDCIIDLEHQSDFVNFEKLKALNLYSVHASYYFVSPVIPIVLTDVESYDKSIKEYEIAGHLICKPKYIYFTLDEISEKLDNILLKHDLKETLSDIEGMDIAFLPIISPRHMRKHITNLLVKRFNGFKINNKLLHYVIFQVLQLMLNYFFEGDELIELRELLNMEFEEAIEKLFDSRFNEMNDELYWMNKKLRLINEKKEDSLSDARLASVEREIALADAKLFEYEKNRYLEILKYLFKEGKLTLDELNSFGVIL